MATITLPEYTPTMVAPSHLSPAVGEALWRRYDAGSGQLRVEFPSPATGQQWRLTALGWVGALPVTPALQLRLDPRVRLANLLRMLDVAYNLRSLHFLPGLVETGSIEGFYERLAELLARRLLARAARGLHRRYVRRRQPLPYVRGQVRWREQRPLAATAPSVFCRFDEHTSDVTDNQIVAFTLGQIARSRRCRPAVQRVVRQAYRAVASAAAERPFRPEECAGRDYGRLNQDYEALHALCRFFLDHSGPAGAGPQQMIPFLVNMPRLFEQFVAAWLGSHLPPGWRLASQEQVTVGRQRELRFNIDIVLYDERNRPRLVLDTKYRTPARVENTDFSQVATYARARGCPEAALVLPLPLPAPLDVDFDGLQIRTLALELGGDLEENGRAFLEALLSRNT